MSLMLLNFPGSAPQVPTGYPPPFPYAAGPPQPLLPPKPADDDSDCPAITLGVIVILAIVVAVVLVVVFVVLPREHSSSSSSPPYLSMSESSTGSGAGLFAWTSNTSTSVAEAQQSFVMNTVQGLEVSQDVQLTYTGVTFAYMQGTITAINALTQVITVSVTSIYGNAGVPYSPWTLTMLDSAG